MTELPTQIHENTVTHLTQIEIEPSRDNVSLETLLHGTVGWRFPDSTNTTHAEVARQLLSLSVNKLTFLASSSVF